MSGWILRPVTEREEPPMRSSIKAALAFMLLVAGSALASAALADATSDEGAAPSAEMEHKFEKAKKYYGECRGVDEGDFEAIKPYLKAFTDAEVMADMMSHPTKAAALMAVVNDPRTIHVMMKCSTEPVMWDTWMRGITDMQKMTRVGMRFMNPGIYMNWMMAPMNPAMYSAMAPMMNPNMYTLWMNAAMNPAFYQPMFAPANPAWYTPRIQWMMDPRSFQPMYNMYGMPVPGMPMR